MRISGQENITVKFICNETIILLQDYNLMRAGLLFEMHVAYVLLRILSEACADGIYEYEYSWS